MKKIKENINLKINKDTVFLFDMDGTLIDTDFANFLSYKKAIQLVVQTGKEIHYIPNERFSRATLTKITPKLTEKELEKIIQLKEENYIENLTQTKLNIFIADILIQYSKTNKTVLVTNCREDRALMTLNYHNLTNRFSTRFFRQISENGERINKYQNAINCLKLSPQNIIIFENEKAEIDDAIIAGILINNIISF